MNTISIRNAVMNDLDKISEIEMLCFPEAEAAPKKVIEERLSVYSKGFFVAEKNGEIIGFINGGSTDNDSLEDDFFKTMSLHKDDGKNLVIFGLDVHPNYQKNGYAKLLMNHFIDFAKKENKSSVLLTCKNHLIHYYESFGYKNFGVSESTHGGAKWYDMVINI